MRFSACSASTCSKSSSTKSEHKNADVQAEGAQARAEFGVRNTRVAGLEARAIELENQLEQSPSQVRVAEFKYWISCNESLTLKQELAMGISCGAEIEQLLMNGSKVVLGYMDALHLKAVKSQNTVRESFRGSFAPLVQRLQTSFTQEVAVASRVVDDSGCEALIGHCGRISECEAAVKGRLDKLEGGDRASPGTSAAVPEAGGIGGASGAGP